MKRELTDSAKAAKLIKSHLKANGIKSKASSENFSMGSSVTVTVVDVMPATAELIRRYAEQYEYGTFDGMTDCSGYKNSEFDGPQAKYVHVNCEWSEELADEAKVYAEKYWDDHAGWYEGNYRFSKESFYRTVLSGDEGNFWASRKPRIRIAA